MFKRKRGAARASPQADPQQVLGPELAAKLVNVLGPDRLAAFAGEAVADAKQRWTRRFDKDVLDDEERAAMGRMAQQAGANTIETRAAFIVVMLAKKISAQAALDALQRENLPQEMVDGLWEELGERLRTVLD